MRILDIYDNEIQESDLNLDLGQLVEEKIVKAHHEAIEAVEEESHIEYGIYNKDRVFVPGERYPSGGQVKLKVVDIPGVEAKEAWTEYEDIQRYIPYTEEELAELEAERNKPTQLDIIEAQITYTAMMTDTLLEV